MQPQPGKINDDGNEKVKHQCHDAYTAIHELHVDKPRSSTSELDFIRTTSELGSPRPVPEVLLTVSEAILSLTGRGR